jgi:uncharacterized protein (TIGR00369 family)
MTHTLSADEVSSIIANGLPGAKGLGFSVEEVRPEGVTCRMRYSDKQLRPGGTLSGPTMMALADAAMYAAVLARLGRLEMAVTQNLNINFLSRPEPADLIAKAEVLKLGRRSVVLDVRIFSEGRREVVAHATGTYSLPPPKSGGHS